jgi:hypothetical protein
MVFFLYVREVFHIKIMCLHYRVHGVDGGARWPEEEERRVLCMWPIVAAWCYHVAISIVMRQQAAISIRQLSVVLRAQF